MLRALAELLQAGGTAYADVEKAGQDAVKKIASAGDGDTSAAIALLKNADAAFDVLQEGTNGAYDRFIRQARTTVTEAQARQQDD